MIGRKRIKQASVLLVTIAMVLSTVAVTAFSENTEPLEADADGPYEGFVNEDIEFMGNATGGVPPYTWYWDFGDEANSTEQNPFYAYDEIGIYTVTLTVTDSESIIDSDMTNATITEQPCDIEIEIKGGFGLTATINNTGNENITGLEYNIALDGGFILFPFGGTTNGTVDVPAGEEVPVHVFVFGFGRPTINVTAGCAEATAKGMVILFFVLGVQ